MNDRSTEQERTNELNKLQEAEVRTLQQQLKKVTTELDLSHRDSQRTVDRLHQDVSVAQRDVADLKRKNDSLEQRATTSTSELLKLRAQVESLEQDKQAHDLKIEILHQDFAETTLKEREEWKRKVAEADSRSQRFEDDAIERGRERDAVRREVKSLESALLVERSNVAAEEKARKAAEAQSDQQHIVLASMDKIIADLRAELSLTKKDLDMYKEQAGRTVVSSRRLIPSPTLLTSRSHAGRAHPCAGGGSSQARSSNGGSSQGAVGAADEGQVFGARSQGGRRRRESARFAFSKQTL